MGKIAFAKEDFPKKKDVEKELDFTMASLVHAVTVAGERPGARRKTLPARSRIAMRIDALKAAVKISRGRLQPTAEFSDCVSDDQRQMSFVLGCALCAHAANVELSIPWLLDFEKLGSKYKIKKTANKLKPDYLGWDARGKWYVFEAKGRASSPGPAAINDWKLQAKTVQKVNGKLVENCIVSAAYIQRNEWKLLWKDPTPQMGPKDFEFEVQAFFDAYYSPILEAIREGGDQIETPHGNLRSIKGNSVYVGIHRNVLAAIQTHDTSGLFAFALKMEESERIDEGFSLFRDGVIIKLGTDWNENIIGGNHPIPDEKSVQVRGTYEPK